MIRFRALVCSLVVLMSLVPAGAAGRRPPVTMPNGGTVPEGMQAIDTPDYTVYSDLPDPLLNEVTHRLEKMVAEYRYRTDSLSDRVDHRKLPLYLFSNRDDYMGQGGRQDSAGFFDGQHLLAYIGVRPDARAWNVIQHEAFHQYLAGKLGHEVPVWLNEGLAEYFGESLFTGDGFVSGLAPTRRVKRLQESVKADTLPSVRELIEMPHAQWNAKLRQENYDMAWSLVQFLAHGDGGKYQEDMIRYVQEARGERLAIRAFGEIFGPADAVQERWKEYWLTYPAEESKRTFAIAAMETVCSYVARANLMRQPVRSMAQLELLAKKEELQQPKADTLPLSLLAEYLRLAPDLGTWDFAPKSGAMVELTMEGGTKVRGRYSVRNMRVDQVEAWIDDGKGQVKRGKRKG